MNAEIFLLRSDRMARGQVQHWKHGSNGNKLVDPIRISLRVHAYMRWKLAANIIAESMYVQCDVNVNEYLLFEEFINHRKDCSDLNVGIRE